MTDPQPNPSSVCDYCRNKLSKEELEFPNKDSPETCDECYHEHFEFTCCRCENYEHEDYQHRFLVVFEDMGEDEDDIKKGIYEIIRLPYYTTGLIGSGWLHNHALRKLKALVTWENDGGYPCGHLCRDCCKKLHLRHSGAGRKLHSKAEGITT